LDLDRFFEVIMGGQPSLPLKPDPQVLQNILERLSVPPARAVMIGDGENDVLVGRAAGVITCAVTYGFRPAEKLLALQPDFVAHAPENLIDFFL
jgi:phosphoglycolate phosphatase-like HAD superfamily hydrolase